MKLISIERVLEEMPPDGEWKRFKATDKYIITIEVNEKIVKFDTTRRK